jgi:hypothetical protein
MISRSRLRQWGRLAIVMAAPCVAWLGACGTDRPNAAGDGTNLGAMPGSSCATPNDGCPCIEPGLVVPCGKVVHQSADYVTCSMGHRQCIGAQWGTCIGDTDVTTRSTSFSILGAGISGGGDVRPLGLGSPSACTTTGGALGGTLLCVGGAKDGEKCKNGVVCPGGVCSAGKCSGGANDEKGCNVAADCPGGSCNLGDGKCVGGTQDTGDCKLNVCPGGTCTAFVGTCDNGTNDDNGCNTAADCPGGTCQPGQGFCIGGPKDGKDCKSPAQCPGGTCYAPSLDAGVSLANPCDPYCNQVIDTPGGLVLGGGLVSVDGGLSIVAGEAGADASAPGTPLQTTSTGDSACAPGSNVHSATCTIATQLTDCQQDFRCDPLSLTCVWNGGPGYFDPTAAGVDLTVGAACTIGGFPGPTNVPVCNRGSATVPAGTPIGINVSNPPSVPLGCTAIGPADCSGVAPATGLAPGECINILGCPSLVPGNKFLTVNAGQRDILEPGGRCANNASWGKTAGGCAVCGTCNTQVTGKVYDPSGAPPTAGANNVFLAGVTVFEPSGALAVLPDVAACDTCTGLDSPSIAKAVTAADGTFTLSGVTPGNTSIVVQSGRWRRQIKIPVTACAVNAVTAGTLRMPKNRTDGLAGVADIPRTALVLSDNESLECLLLKMGISNSEFAAYSVAAPQRIRLFQNNGLAFPGAPAAVPNVFGALNEHAQTIFDCDGAAVFSPSPLWSSTTAAQKAALQTYTSVGGKVFMDHLPGQTFLMTGPAPFSGVSTWNPALYQNNGLSFPSKGKVFAGTAPQTQFLAWLGNVSAMTDYGSPYIRSDVPRRHSLNPAAAQTTTWIRGETANDWAGDPTGDFALSFSFEMGKVGAVPTVNADCGSPTGHGRVIYNGMHVSQSRAPWPASGNFPASCNLAGALTPEEKALEYQLFQLTACQLGGASPPPPPLPPPPLAAVVYTRDYAGSCATGERVKWGPFYWESVIPPGTSIKFDAATADTIPALPAAPAAGAPTTANVGTASATVLPPAFDCTGCPAAPVTVESQLIADTATKSKAFLRVYMKFNPTATVSPSLLSWRQVYDCVPAE